MAQKYLVIGFLLLVTATSTIYYFDYFCCIPVTSTSVNHQSQSVLSVVAYQSDPAELCAPPLAPPTSLAVEDRAEWRRIDNNTEWHVYSVYVDRRRSGAPIARIIAMARKGASATLSCRWWWQHGNGTLPVRAQKQELWLRTWDSPEPDQYYRPFLLSCLLPRSRDTAREPFAVSVTTNACGHVSSQRLLRLDWRSSANASVAGFAVCLKPLDFDADVSARLVEWLELQYLLGADTVRAYVRKVHPATRRTLRHYAKLGRLVAVEHAPPGAGSESAASLWQKRRREMAVYNDCFYAHLHSHRFVLNLDLDEAVVPVAGDTWADMLADAPHDAASLSVRNVYYFDAFGGVEDASIPCGMHMLRHVVRSRNFAPHGFAQKSFFATESAEAVTNHFALRAARRDVRLLVGLGTDRGRLHHYRRDCPPLMERDCEENYMKFRERDALLWKYKERLVVNFQKTMRDLGELTETK